MIKKYVVGFMFAPNGRDVVLIQKNRPEWQKDKLNGVGGKIEPGETPEAAMVREFYEETGVMFSDWTKFATLRASAENDPTGIESEIHFFRATSNLANDIETLTDEAVYLVPVNTIMPKVPNLAYLLPMAQINDLSHAELTYQ